MSMKKKLFFAAIALTTLAGCTDESYVGDQNLLTNDGGAISFNMKTPAITRSDASTAGKLGNEFVVYGYKTTSTPTDQVVFDNYVVKWVDNTASTTESNSANWEYVSYTSKATTPVEQSIKYWDFGAGSYDFFAYSLGKGDEANHTHATASVMTNSTYTLSGTGTQLGACYISKKYHIEPPSSSTTQVTLQFVSFLSKIQLKFFETIPGYAVKDLRFYNADGTKTDSDNSGDKDGLVPALYTTSTLPTGGTYSISFDAAYAPVVTLTSASATDTKISFPAVSTSPSTVWLDNYATTLDYHEAESAGEFLAREASSATSTSQITALPNSTGAALTLKMDYTLVSRDGTGENIQVTGKTATVPAAYTKWKPNYAYTYIFKITDNELVPITLDAVVTDAQDGSQETITTVTTPSITTYAKESNVLTDNEYKSGANIYVVVNNGEELTVGTNVNLYTAEVEAGAAQGITEETVANAIAVNSDKYDFGTVLAYGTDLTGYWTYADGTYTACSSGTADGTTKYYKPVTASVKDANGKKLVINAASGLTAITKIDAADSPTGNDITVNGAKFTPSAVGTYVIEFIDTSSNKNYYKVIKVVAAP